METTLVAPQTYRRISDHDVRDEAVRYTAESCSAIHAWLEQSHDDNECRYAYDHGYGFEIATSSQGLLRVPPDHWVIRDFHGFYHVMNDVEFKLRYEDVA